jgi:hypothetical protein
VSDEKLPANALINVTMEICIPVSATDDEISEWLNDSVGHGGGCSTSNPLLHWDAVPFCSTSLNWENTGRVGRKEKIDREKHEDGSETYRIRYFRERPV